MGLQIWRSWALISGFELITENWSCPNRAKDDRTHAIHIQPYILQRVWKSIIWRETTTFTPMQGHWCSDMWVCGNLLMFVNFCRLARSCIVLIGRPMTLTSRDDCQTFAIQIRISYTFTGYCEMMKRNCHRSPTHTVLRWKRLGFSFSRSLVVVFLSCTQDVWANGSSCCSSGASTGKGEVEGCALYYPNDAPLQQGWITLDHAQKKHSKIYIYNNI